MPISYVRYALANGFVDNWLVAGPQVIPLAGFEPSAGQDRRREIAGSCYEKDSGISEMPVERGPLTAGTFRVGDYEGSWSYHHCREDHLVDHTARLAPGHYLRSWAYAQVVSGGPQRVTFTMATHGPADLWVNGQHVHRQEGFSDRRLQSADVEVTLRKGANEVLVRFEQVTACDSPHAMALSVQSRPGEWPAARLSVRLPTLIQPVGRRNGIERVLEAAYVDRGVYRHDAPVVVRWPKDLKQAADATLRLQTPSGRIYAEARVQGAAGGESILGSPQQSPPGPYRIVLMPRLDEYYEKNVRLRHELRIWAVGNNSYSEAPYGTQAERRQEALVSASYRDAGLFCEIARMALGRWSMVQTGAILEAAEGIRRGDEGSALHLVGVLGMLHRFGDDDSFPEVLREPLQACIRGFEYRGAVPCLGESQAILLHTAEILAGQLCPEHTFAGSGRSGRWHREEGERLALDWLHRRAAYGFAEWDSHCFFADSLVALSHLVDLAESDQVYEMAAVLMDKMLLTIALNSYKGVFGSTHGSTCSPAIQGGLLEPTAGITRLLWGQGIFNHHLAGTVSLACLEEYQVPPIIADIAASPPEEMWDRERHVAGPGEGAQAVNKVTYRTPDYMLSSAQDYHPGEHGRAEHIWQATLGPEAVVFANHPACASGDDGRRPGFWLGNQVLPRVAQWKDVLIAIHNLPEDDWMGFTHAYFPTHAFDEHMLRDGWAFARKGDGYLALTATQGLSLVTGGHSACRELRSPAPTERAEPSTCGLAAAPTGRQNVWLCHMGRAALDGGFEAFQEKVLALEMVCDGLSVRCNTLRGDTLSFGWEGPLLRNGQVQALAGFKHYKNPYSVAELGAEQMEVQTEAYLLRLRFGSLEEPPA
jgi:hypothetical protein